ncbi:AAA family ATPase [Propioniciclava soli]|uniref:AAA family ATPase n=1 Tax=Propioniciclava soli TaxID=2775081 RepID=UPI001E50BC86|nr:AAA family ATPase [Propioniciclava soli]
MLLVVFGPPAVGKMTVGRALAESGRFRLFHNHMTIEPLLETFGFETPPFDTLNSEFRRRVLEASRPRLTGLCSPSPRDISQPWTCLRSPSQHRGGQERRRCQSRLEWLP